MITCTSTGRKEVIIQSRSVSQPPPEKGFPERKRAVVSSAAAFLAFDVAFHVAFDVGTSPTLSWGESGGV